MSDTEPAPDPVPVVEETTEPEVPGHQDTPTPEEPAAEEVSHADEAEEADKPEEAEADEAEAEEAAEEEEAEAGDATEEEEAEAGEAEAEEAAEAEAGEADDGGDGGEAEANVQEEPERAPEEAPEESAAAADESEGPLHPNATLSRDGIVRADFDSLVALIDDPAWEPLKNKSGIEMKCLRGEDGLQHIRGDFELAMTPAEFSELVSGHDFEARKKWDKRCIRWDVKERFDEHHDVMHYAVSSGFPFVWNRAMLLERIRLHEDSGEVLMFATSIDRPDLRPIEDDAKEKLERAHVHVSGYRAVPSGESGCHVTFVLKIDLKGRLSMAKSNASAEKTVLSHANIAGLK